MITRLGKRRYFRVAGFALGAVFVASAAVLVTASASGFSFSPRSAGPSQVDTAVETAAISEAANPSANMCAAFMKHLAVDLSRTQADINKAVQKAIGEMLADEVANKDLTPAQAEAVKAKFANQSACAMIAGAAKTGAKTDKGERGQHGASYLPQYISAAAAVLGITDAQLKTNLSNGQTLSQMAANHKPAISQADFRTALLAKLRPSLDTAVTNKQMTAAQEQSIIDRLKTGALPYWDKPMKKNPGATSSPANA